MLPLNLLCVALGCGIVWYQARGRHESLLKWLMIYLYISGFVLIIPKITMPFGIFLLLPWGLTALMGPWRRPRINIVNHTTVKPQQIIEDLRNVEGIDDHTDIIVTQAEPFLLLPVQLKCYFNANEILVLERDIATLRQHHIPHTIKRDVFVTIFVAEAMFPAAASVLGIDARDLHAPSLN